MSLLVTSTFADNLIPIEAWVRVASSPGSVIIKCVQIIREPAGDEARVRVSMQRTGYELTAGEGAWFTVNTC